MLSYIARRLLIAIPALLGVLIVTFFFLQLLPGDPLSIFMSPDQSSLSAEYIARRRAEFGLDQPWFLQFWSWLTELAQGNLGYSIHRGLPVTEMYADRIGATILLISTGMVAALVIGVPAGIIAATRQNSWFDRSSSMGSMVLVSFPTFFVGLILVYVFSLQLGLLPSGGLATVGAEPSFIDRLRHLALPAAVLAIALVGPYARYTRQSMLEVLRQDYMSTAKAKGLSHTTIIVAHGLRNALIPLTTVVAIQIPELLAGTVIIESIFSWPGVGSLVLEAINTRDYPVIIAMTLISAIMVMLCNLAADILTGVLDPRIRL